MTKLIRNSIPHGIVAIRELYYQLRYLGLPRQLAALRCLDFDTKKRLKRSNLDLLTGRGLADLACAVDIGANHGDWSADLLRFSKPSKLLVVEPNPELTPHLRARFSKNDSVEILPFALGSNDGSIAFNVMEKSDMSSLLTPTLRAQDAYGIAAEIKESITVPIKLLDSLTDQLERIDLLKLDVQGYEREVIAGAKESLKKTSRVLIEINFVSHYAGDLTFAPLDELMSQHGFYLANYSTPHWGKGRQVFWADALYINSHHIPK